MFQVKQGEKVLAQFSSFVDAFFWANAQKVTGRLYVGGRLNGEHVYQIFNKYEKKR